MFSKTFFLHCTNVYITRQSHPLFNGQRSTNGNNEPFQWNYQRSIINYCPRGGSMDHAASHSTTPHHTQQNTIALENIVGWDCSQIIWSKTILDSVGEPAPVFQIGQLWFVGLSCAYWAASARLHILLSCSMLLFFCYYNYYTLKSFTYLIIILAPNLPAWASYSSTRNSHSFYAILAPFPSNTIQGIPNQISLEQIF